MSDLLINDQSSRLKQFSWEELDENFFLVVIFRSARRYVVQRHFEQQLLDIRSASIQNKWRRCLLEVISKSTSVIYLTRNEVELMHEILSWHLNSPNNYLRLRDRIDVMIDLEDLIDCSRSISGDQNDAKAFLIQPVTTLDAARKNIELWKNWMDTNDNQIREKQVKRKTPSEELLTSTNAIPMRTVIPLVSSSLPSNPPLPSTTGWLQLDSKIVPFIKKHCDHLLSVEYLLKEHVINSSEDFSLRSLYIPISSDDLQTFKLLSRPNVILTNQSSLITLDHLIFRLKRLFFIRFLSSPSNLEQIDYHQVMSCNGGLLTLLNAGKQRLPFLYINKRKYIPQTMNEMNSSALSTFCMANQYELEYLRLISLYDYLSSEEQNDSLIYLSSVNNLILLPVDFYCEQQCFTIISLNDFHYHEYQRRTQQQKNLISYDDNQLTATGWWQPPLSLKQKSPLSHFKLQEPILF